MNKRYGFIDLPKIIQEAYNKFFINVGCGDMYKTSGKYFIKDWMGEGFGKFCKKHLSKKENEEIDQAFSR